jgi:DNA-binding transcriptional MerR regulator
MLLPDRETSRKPIVAGGGNSIYMIGDLARMTGLSIDTINYYLRIGLIYEVSRSPRNNYRYFDDRTVDSLNKIMSLRLKKLPIREIKRMLDDELL